VHHDLHCVLRRPPRFHEHTRFDAEQPIGREIQAKDTNDEPRIEDMKRSGSANWLNIQAPYRDKVCGDDGRDENRDKGSKVEAA
jgi:hypothetical protein